MPTEKQRAAAKRYYDKHKDKINKRRRADPTRAEKNRKWRLANPDKARQYSRSHYLKNPARARDRELQRLYGLTFAEYTAMVLAQKGRCALCGTRPKPGQKSLCVDHDHATGKVRELLCVKCNRFVGLLEKDPDLTYNVIEYLEAHR